MSGKKEANKKDCKKSKKILTIFIEILEKKAAIQLLQLFTEDVTFFI